MTDKEQIIKDYEDMYQYMVDKDTLNLGKLMSEDFVLIHMTGMRQDKKTYLKCIADGTLNYYSAVHKNSEVTINGNHAVLIGQSLVEAAVFGGGKHTWRLQLEFLLRKQGNKWVQYQSKASVF